MVFFKSEMPTKVAESAEIIDWTDLEHEPPSQPGLKVHLRVEDLSSFGLNLGQIPAWSIAG